MKRKWGAKPARGKGYTWITDGWRIVPGSRLLANLKRAAWCEIHEKSDGRYVGYVSVPTEGKRNTDYELPACWTPATAKKRVEKALLEFDCLIDRTTIGRDPQPGDRR